MIYKLKIKEQEFILVGVPKYAYDFSNTLVPHQIDFTINTPYKESFIKCRDSVILEDYWNIPLKIIGAISSISEEDCFDLVDSKELSSLTKHGMQTSIWYMDYNQGINISSIGESKWEYKTAKESFISRLKSNDILAQSFVGKPLALGEATEAILFYNEEMGQYNKLPEELILIKINND